MTATEPRKPALKVKYPNLQSRILLQAAFRRQNPEPAPLPDWIGHGLERIERWICGVDIREVPLDRPIFLIGMLRSGTSMTQDLLCSHPDVAFISNAMLQLPSAPILVDTVLRSLNLNAEAERFIGDSVPIRVDSPADATLIWGYYFGFRDWRHFLLLDGLDHRASEAQIASSFVSSRDRLVELFRKVVWNSGQPYRRFFTKQLASALGIKAMLQQFPDARFLHVIRNPEQVANSTVKLHRRNVLRRKRWWHVRAPSPQVLIPRWPRLPEYVERYGVEDPRASASIWRDHIDYLDEIKHALPHYHEFRYEDLLADPRTVLGEILEFLELDPVPAEHAAYWDLFHRIGVTHHRNDYGRFDEIRAICGEAMRRHGYEA